MLVGGEAADHELGFAAVVGRFDDAAVALQQGVGRAADALVGIDHQDALADQRRPQLDAADVRLGLGRGHRLADLLDHLLDVAGIAQDLLQPLDHVRLVADVALHHVDGVVQDVVDRQRDGAVDRLDAGRGRARLFGASSSSVLSATATSRAKISRNCRSLSLNARGSGLSTLSVPITRSCSMTGTVNELRAFWRPSR